MRVPGLAPGEMPHVKIDQLPEKDRTTLQSVAAYERELYSKMLSAPTYLLFNKPAYAGGSKDDLRMQLGNQYIGQLLKEQSYLFPSQLLSIGKPKKAPKKSGKKPHSNKKREY